MEADLELTKRYGTSTAALVVRILAGTLTLAAGIVWFTGASTPSWWGVLLLASGALVLGDAVLAWRARSRR